jgi:phosphonate transport system permease protein
LASALAPVIENALAREAAFRHRRLGFRVALGTLFLIILWASAARINISPAALVQGVPSMFDFFVRMFPPDLSFFGLLIEPAIETVQIAAWGTLLAVIGSAPLALLAAHTTSPHFVLYSITRIFSTSCAASTS